MIVIIDHSWTSEPVTAQASGMKPAALMDLAVDSIRTTTWDEAADTTVRGTLVVLTGRGETLATYARLGSRLAADAYRVHIVQADPDQLEATEAFVEYLLHDASPRGPKVLIGADTGSLTGLLLASRHTVDAVILAGLVMPAVKPHRIFSWEAELEARTACLSHRRTLRADPAFHRRSLDNRLPATLDSLELTHPGVPTLVIHGSADPLTSAEDAFSPFFADPRTRSLLVCDGRHDVLNDVSHRSVAASIVLFLESLRLGSWLPSVVQPIELM